MDHRPGTGEGLEKEGGFCICRTWISSGSSVVLLPGAAGSQGVWGVVSMIFRAMFPWETDPAQVRERGNRSQMGLGGNANISTTSRTGVFEHLGDDGKIITHFPGKTTLICSEAGSGWSRNWKTQPWKAQFYLQPISAAQLIAIPIFLLRNAATAPRFLRVAPEV